jgi:phosphoribosylanthranilate isomerase
LTRTQDVQAAVEAGADALGFVFYPDSPRALTLSSARALVDAVPAFVTTVGLFVNADRQTVLEARKQLGLGLLQFHGDEDASYCASFACPWMKAIRVASTTDIAAEVARYPGASAMLLDTFRAGTPGGTGEVFDWRRIPPGLPAPLVVAGGLKADNVGAAISAARPYAVDVSGGVESEPGIKERRMIEDFVAAVRTADHDHDLNTR